MMSSTEIEGTSINPDHCAASGQPLPPDVIKDCAQDPNFTHFYCPVCAKVLPLPESPEGFVPRHTQELEGDQELIEPTFSDLLDDPVRLIEALASIQLTGKQREHLGQLFASADGEEAHRDIGNRLQSLTRISCSKIGGHLIKHFGVNPRGDKMMLIGYMEHDTDGGERWVLRPQIRSALVHLGWFGIGPTIPSATAPTSGWAGNVSPQHTADLTDEEALLAAVQKSMSDDPAARAARLAVAPKVPEKYQQTRMAFKRNPDVIAAVRIRAAGTCEACQKPAPFPRVKDGTPYLEVHHKVQLSADGFDTVDNAIAVCPNCHRKAHYGSADSSGASSSSLHSELDSTH